jgi:hypothetical protein
VVSKLLSQLSQFTCVLFLQSFALHCVTLVRPRELFPLGSELLVSPFLMLPPQLRLGRRMLCLCCGLQLVHQLLVVGTLGLDLHCVPLCLLLDLGLV